MTRLLKRNKDKRLQAVKEGEKKDKYYILKLSKLVTGSDERDERFSFFLYVSSTRAEGASADSPR